ncbi:MAG: response regulator transcription factor [Prolixibacteraceae bacterium]|nr:response regulator transcription factor [Prolixibacteraceae bacterium]MBN2772742.1 response regulator transcription factor [Prolixibacteraceae bacterium]
MYKCIVIDDEPIARRIIKGYLEHFNEFEISAECSNALEAMTVLSKQKFDLMFCDIQMPRITGIEFIRSLAHPPGVIFTTAYRDYAVEAFDLNVVDYLVKPFSIERFAKSINRFLEINNNISGNYDSEKKITNQAVFLKADKKFHKIDLDDILWFESLGDYIIVFTESGKITTKERIGAIADLLPKDKFLRIHRGYIVSIRKINTIGPGFIEIGKKKLPIGRLYKTEVQKLIETNSNT